METRRAEKPGDELHTPEIPFQNIGIGQIGVGRAPEKLHTILGSCVAVILMDESRKLGGLAHIMLPEGEGSRENPAKYANSGIPELIRRVVKEGAERKRLAAKITGGARMFKTPANTLTDIGGRNIAAVKILLGKENIRILAEDLGGESGRKVVFDPATSRVIIGTIKGERREI